MMAYLRELNMVSMTLRLLLAMLYGGLIGIERAKKRRPAGFRTYMLVCLGSAATMILSFYLQVMLGGPWAEAAAQSGSTLDLSRLGAQVINGIGFLGAGTILVTGRQEVKGLTTAAGLWASACMGLAIGAGFYECFFVGSVLILLCMRFFPRLEGVLLSRSPSINLYVEIDSAGHMSSLIERVKEMNVKICDIEISRRQEERGDRQAVNLYLLSRKRCSHAELIARISSLECVQSVDEI